MADGGGGGGRSSGGGGGARSSGGGGGGDRGISRGSRDGDEAAPFDRCWFILHLNNCALKLLVQLSTDSFYDVRVIGTSAGKPACEIH